MLFLTHWKLNEDMSVADRHEIAETLTQEGALPPDGVEILRWDGTPDGWGIVLWETDDHAAMDAALNMWPGRRHPLLRSDEDSARSGSHGNH